MQKVDDNMHENGKADRMEEAKVEATRSGC